MNRKYKYFLLFFTTFTSFFWMLSCKNGARRDAQHGEPVLSYDPPVYVEETKTYDLVLSSSNTTGASLSFDLLLDDSVIMANKDGQFSGIKPYDYGYDVKMVAIWKDTSIERTVHIMNFNIPVEVDRMTVEGLEQLINTRDRSIRQNNNNHLAQDVRLIVNESRVPNPKILPDVITLITNGVWRGVRVLNIEYNSYNQINCITLQPVGEQIMIVDEDEDVDY